MAQSAGTAEYTDFISKEGLDFPNGYHRYDTKQSDCEVPVMLELSGIHSTIIAIPPKSTMACSGSTR